MCVSKVQHLTGRKTGCNRSRPVFFGFSIFRQTSQLATEKIQNSCNRNRWSGLLRLGSVRFRSFFQSSELDLRTLVPSEDASSQNTWEKLRTNQTHVVSSMAEYLLVRHILNEPHTNLSLPNTPHAIQQKEFSMAEFIVAFSSKMFLEFCKNLSPSCEPNT